MLDLTVVISGTWTAPGSGSWADTGNWTANVIPDGVGSGADFDTSIGSNAATVTMDGPHTVGNLTFNTSGGGSYTITGTDTLTMDRGLAAATVNVLSGSHTIAVPVALASDLDVSIAGDSGLTISGPISETTAGRSLSLGGAGLLVLSGSDTYSGATVVTGGTLELARAPISRIPPG